MSEVEKNIITGKKNLVISETREETSSISLQSSAKTEELVSQNTDFRICTSVPPLFYSLSDRPVQALRDIMGNQGKIAKKQRGKMYVYLHISILRFIFERKLIL